MHTSLYSVSQGTRGVWSMSFVFITVAAWAPVDSNLALSVVAAPGHDDGSAAEHGCDRLVSLENGELDAIGTQMQRMVQSLFRGRWTRLCTHPQLCSLVSALHTRLTPPLV